MVKNGDGRWTIRNAERYETGRGRKGWQRDGDDDVRKMKDQLYLLYYLIF